MDKDLSVSDYGICLFSVEILQELPFNDEWEKKLEYDGFNIEIKDSLWISSIGEFHEFDANGFCGNKIDVT